jgi:hypothetical protein
MWLNQMNGYFIIMEQILRVVQENADVKQENVKQENVKQENVKQENVKLYNNFVKILTK